MGGIEMRKKLLENRTSAILEGLLLECYTKESKAELLRARAGSYPLEETVTDQEETTPFGWEDTWGSVDGHTWFTYDLVIPKEYSKKEVVGMVSTGATDIWNTDNPQILVYHNGKLDATLDMNHQEFVVSKEAVEGEKHRYSFYAYANTSGKTNFFQLRFAVFHREVYELYYDMKTIYEAVLIADEDDSDCYDAMEALQEAIQVLDLRKASSPAFYTSVKKAREVLKAYLDGGKEAPVTVYGIGHTHIDVAWKWPVKQTRQKVVRSFLTVLRLMEEYPEYVFLSSQPQLYEFVKEDAPEVYERIKERIGEGRWEPEGAMWLEADCNLSSGESLIRHILHGTRFMKNEFGVKKQEILWLPDVFGYNAALPQIMEKSGIKYFMTTKIAWNDTNKMPNDVMYWEGIDGSKVLTYFISTSDYRPQPRQKELERFETTYNGRMNPSQVKGTWQRFSNKYLSKNVLTCYGFGDGGGGTTREMLEYARRMKKGICGVPKVKLAKAGEFFHRLEEDLQDKKVPVWSGELYLEYHRGTYTSMGRIKKKNRQAEMKNQYTEGLSVLASRYTNHPYDRTRLHSMWKLTLLNQFHDIIPGTSIREVYEQCDLDYAEHEKIQREVEESCLTALLGGGSFVNEEEASKYALFNGLGRERGGLIFLKNQTPAWYGGTVSGFGMKQVDLTQLELGQGDTLLQNIEVRESPESYLSFETPYYKVEMTSAGAFTRLYDKGCHREVLQQGKEGNRILVFEDRPKEYDAWNIESYYEEKHWEMEERSSCRIIENTGIRAGILVEKQFLDSTLEQIIYFYKHSQRIDFHTTVDWKEQQLLCKVEFPVEIIAPKAVYEIQFGNAERPTHKNTSWEEAMFEVCAHKWADLSECGYGVALLNDCKYGYDIHDSNLRLTLIKSGIFPHPDADKEVHQFRYALFPHNGDFREGKVIWEAYALNAPLVAYPLTDVTEIDNYQGVQVEEDHVVLETCKALEDGEGYVIRMYEAYGKRGNIHLKAFMFDGMSWCLGNLLEQPETSWSRIKDGEISLSIKPYEIVTILVKTNE